MEKKKKKKMNYFIFSFNNKELIIIQ